MSLRPWLAAGFTVFALLAGAVAPGAARAVDCRPLTHDGRAYTICEVDATEDLRLFLRDGQGQVMGSFSAVEAELGRPLAFAMNAGMFGPDRAPVGLYVEPGHREGRLTDGGGYGNFGLLPNGVFCIGAGWVRVIEREAFAAEQPACRYVTQSGPMLVIGGALHPAFQPQSTSRLVRNGVGTSADGGTAVFAISDEPVSFHEFARLFRDGLGLHEALYLDGNVSRLYAPGLNRKDAGRPLGPIVGVLAAPE